MNRILLITGLILLAVQAGAETLRHPDELVLPDLAFEMPVAAETRLANGIRVLVFENHDLPLVSLVAYLPMGTRYLSPDRHPACRAMDRVWDQGGIGDYTPAEVDAKVAALGMSLGAGIGLARAYVQASMVREDLLDGALMWSELLLRPQFSTERLDRAKARLIKDNEGINDDPNRLAEAWFMRLLSGENSPEGHVFTREEIDSVDQQDLQLIYEEFVRPDRVVIGISGDITMTESVALLEPLIGNWQREDDTSVLEPHAWHRTPRSGVFLLPGDFEQCHLRMGLGWPELTDLSVDYPEARLLDFGFGYLRVYYRARTDGLSYGTTTRLVADADRGKFWAFGSTRPEKIVDLITAVREEVMNLRAKPLDEEEIGTARTFILGTKIQSMETARDIVKMRLQEIVLGQPEGYTADLIAGLQAASVESVAAVASRYLDFGENPVVLVVGNPEGGAEALETLGLGPVTVLETVKFGE